MSNINSLWGSEFSFDSEPDSTKKIIKKVRSPKKDISVQKVSTKKSLDVNTLLKTSTQKVFDVLGTYKSNTVCLRTKESLSAYIDACIANGEIAIDTETNHSLDPLTCVLMGACIYTPGQKNAYVPVNHTDMNFQRLDNQVSEKDIYDEFSRLSNTKIIMHNGKFDYQVIKCTCGISLSVYWDTMIGAKLLNENELRVNLKQQYIDKIDPSIEKYSIEGLFDKVPYELVDPDVFALYSATDAYMTYMLYKWQLEHFNRKENEKLLSLMLNIEMPVVEVLAEMELTGICIDDEYTKRLAQKYRNRRDAVTKEIEEELLSYSARIEHWRKTPDANFHPPKKGKSEETQGKSKAEQLENPVNLSSPTQLAILFYDILKVPVMDKKSPRGTGEDILKKIQEKYPDLKLCNLILKQRGIDKLLSTYIDKLPECVSKVDDRLHASFLQYGAQTGRLASKDPNVSDWGLKIRLIQ